ncbi:hypothetical protein J5N97_015201 [Dioscorea zingiberensis]|uniref:CASP-like protein n=1 Tax=Dioscorea zingiberensis TaxID=325984 RepID=A0A9D5HKX9_9LILI|nr:hypothetical protein J5N97_015201 [Dioscorea zingiberensis]
MMEAPSPAQVQAQVKPVGCTMETEHKVYNGRPAASSSSMQLLGFILRFLAIVLTLVATIVMGVAKQTTRVPQIDVETGELVEVDAMAKSTYIDSWVYFIVVNAIAFVYSTFSLGLSIANRTNFRSMEMFISIADLMMLILLFSSNGAAASMAILAEKGNTHFFMPKVCAVVGKFCAHINASIVLSMIASLSYALLVVLAIVSLHNSSR